MFFKLECSVCIEGKGVEYGPDVQYIDAEERFEQVRDKTDKYSCGLLEVQTARGAENSECSKSVCIRQISLNFK